MKEKTGNTRDLEISVVQGEGVGPSVIDSAIKVINASTEHFGLGINLFYSDYFDDFGETAKNFKKLRLTVGSACRRNSALAAARK